MLIRGGKVLLGSLWFDPWGPSAGGTDRGRSPAGVQSPSPPVPQSCSGLGFGSG